MKKALIFILLMIAAISSSKAFDVFNIDTTYTHVAGLNRFAGTWEYKNGGEIFRIVLSVKKEYIKGTNSFMDFVEGYHEYLKNGELVQGGKKESYTLNGGAYYYDFEKKTSNNNSIHFLLADKQRADREDCFITLLPGNKLNWHLKNMEAHRSLMTGKMPDRVIHLPNDIILTKVD